MSDVLVEVAKSIKNVMVAKHSRQLTASFDNRKTSGIPAGHAGFD